MQEPISRRSFMSHVGVVGALAGAAAVLPNNRANAQAKEGAKPGPQAHSPTRQRLEGASQRW